MGMPIEEIIKSFDYIKHVGNGESTYAHYREEMALNEAVAIMRKYQKVEEIYKTWSYGANSCDCMKDIERVVEDRNVD